MLPSTSALWGVNSKSVHLETLRHEGPKSRVKSFQIWRFVNLTFGCSSLKESGTSSEMGSKCGSVLRTRWVLRHF